MKCPFSVQKTWPLGMRFGKLDCCLDAFTARTAKEYFCHLAAGKQTQPLGELASPLGHVTLEHCWTPPLQLVFNRLDDGWMIVTEIVNAIPRQKIQYALAPTGEQFGSKTALVLNIHLHE